MNKRTFSVATVLILVMLLVLACAPQAAPAPAAPAPAPAARSAPAPAAPAAAAKPAWQAEWEKTLAAARQEGKVIVHTVGGGAVPDALRKIARTQGIEAEVIVLRPAEIWPKVVGERRAGLYLNDVYLGGVTSPITVAKPAGVWQPLDSAFILPDLTDPELIKKVWYQGTLNWVDRDHSLLIIARQPGTAIAINTDLVRPDEMRSYRDLLNPKWKGKLGLNDPTTPGYGSMAVQAMVILMAEDYVKGLANMDPIIIRDQRQQVDWLAHGKIAMAIAPAVEVVVEYLNAGAPNIKIVIPQEGTWLGTGNSGSMGFFKNPPHPNASKVFINWLTSKEGQEIMAPAGGFHSTRVDVSSAHLLTGLARVEGVKYADTTSEDAIVQSLSTSKLARDLFGPLIK